MLTPPESRRRLLCLGLGLRSRGPSGFGFWSARLGRRFLVRWLGRGVGGLGWWIRRCRWTGRIGGCGFGVVLACLFKSNAGRDSYGDSDVVVGIVGGSRAGLKRSVLSPRAPPAVASLPRPPRFAKGTVSPFGFAISPASGGNPARRPPPITLTLALSHRGRGDIAGGVLTPPGSRRRLLCLGLGLRSRGPSGFGCWRAR